jgi:hypothetical protein
LFVGGGVKSVFLLREEIPWFYFLYLADSASQHIYVNINELGALNIIMSLFHASTCFEHTCSSSGGQNCTIQPLYLYLYIDSERLQTAYSIKQYTVCSKAFFPFKMSFDMMINV